MPIAAKQKQAGEHLSGAWTASLAVAVEILLRCPMRLSNLVELRFGHEIVHLGSGKQRHTHFLISADSSKTGEPLQWPINPELSVLIELFATEYRRVIGGAGSEYLFAGRDHAERPRAGCGLGTAITRAFREYIGIELHPHLYRALAGRLILDENPGAIEEIRQLLGHRTFTTAMEYYISAQPQRAAARHDSRISTLQRQTRMSAAVAFAEFRPFAFAGNRMKGGGHK